MTFDPETVGQVWYQTQPAPPDVYVGSNTLLCVCHGPQKQTQDWNKQAMSFCHEVKQINYYK